MIFSIITKGGQESQLSSEGNTSYFWWVREANIVYLPILDALFYFCTLMGFYSFDPLPYVQFTMICPQVFPQNCCLHLKRATLAGLARTYSPANGNVYIGSPAMGIHPPPPLLLTLQHS